MGNENSEGPVLDLDELIERPVEFKLFGTTRTIKPIDVRTFLVTTNAWHEFQQKTSSTKDFKEVAIGYYSLFKAYIDQITLDEVMKMSPPQCMSLMLLILRRQHGEDLARTYEQKKKTKKTVPSSTRRLVSALRNLLPKHVLFLVGSLMRF